MISSEIPKKILLYAKVTHGLDKVTALEYSFRKNLSFRSRHWTKEYLSKVWAILLVSCGRYRSERLNERTSERANERTSLNVKILSRGKNADSEFIS